LHERRDNVTPEILVTYGWAFVVLLAACACAWAVLIVQALLYDRRIALVGLAGSVMASLAMLVSGRLSQLIGVTAGALAVIFLLWFMLRYWRRAFVYVPLGVILICAATGAGLYLSIA
jgi:hypothetical protein